jgi:RecA-family ATPase
MTEYLKSYQSSIPESDNRGKELEEKTKKSGIPTHDLRAVDLVGRELLNKEWDFRTAQGIEKDVFILPGKLILDILNSTPVVVRKSILTNDKKQPIYTHRTRPKKLKEHLEEWRRMAARDYGFLYDKNL